jgi:hypothetical protein
MDSERERERERERKVAQYHSRNWDKKKKRTKEDILLMHLQ